MPNTLVVLGNSICQSADGTPPASSRAALALAIRRFGKNFDVCLLQDDLATTHYAIAAGAQRVLRWHLDPMPIFDVALLGSELHPWGDLVAAELALAGEASCVFDVLDAEQENSGLHILRDLEAGARERLLVRGPVVLTISPHADQRKYVSRYRRRLAAQSDAQHKRAPDMPVANQGTFDWQPIRPRVNTARLKPNANVDASARTDAAFGIDTSATPMNGPILADAQTCAMQLLRYLRHHGFLSPSSRNTTIDGPDIKLHAAAFQARPGPSTALGFETVRARIPRPLNTARRGPARWPRPVLADSSANNALAIVRLPRRLGLGPPKRWPTRLTSPDADTGKEIIPK